MTVSPEAFTRFVESMTGSPSSIGAGLAVGEIRPKNPSVGVCRGVPTGLEALEAGCVGTRELGVVARGEVRVGAEEGLGEGGRDVMTRGNLGCLESEYGGFEFGVPSPFTADGEIGV